MRTRRTRALTMFQTPSERGGIVLPVDPPTEGLGNLVFQTPSERGGIVLWRGISCLDFVYSVSNPFRTGRYCAETIDGHPGSSADLFQTPSERGGIVLSGCPTASPTASPSFKPLQNGAVLCCSNQRSVRRPDGLCFKPLQNGAVLCCRVPIRQQQRCCRVSNPFRTGRYCAVLLRQSQPVFWRCFKPLQNGAVLC